MTHKEYILQNEIVETSARNSMGCSENWYNAYYAIKNTFTAAEIEAMNENEVDNLVKLVDAISDALY